MWTLLDVDRRDWATQPLLPVFMRLTVVLLCEAWQRFSALSPCLLDSCLLFSKNQRDISVLGLDLDRSVGTVGTTRLEVGWNHQQAHVGQGQSGH